MRTQSQKRYEREGTTVICRVRLRNKEAQKLLEAKRASGLRWREVIYRGLGLRREHIFKNLDDFLNARRG